MATVPRASLEMGCETLRFVLQHLSLCRDLIKLYSTTSQICVVPEAFISILGRWLEEPVSQNLESISGMAQRIFTNTSKETPLTLDSYCRNYFDLFVAVNLRWECR
ncbi:hypothetical protein F4819DRAFT_481252 [Hypoxylon fuscum]|nr:hypothetical protein F4819DRAFT_481252 [Hypoxylon fuscum]